MKACWGSVGGVWVLIAGFFPILLASCVPPPATSAERPPEAGEFEAAPDWAIHIKAPQAVTIESTPAQIESLRRELLEPELRPGMPYSSPEQIAAMAVAELNGHHEWDAALLLAIATFRYRQQGALVVKLNELDRQQGRVETRQSYAVRQEEPFFVSRPSFSRELQLLRRRLRQDGHAQKLVVAEPGATDDAQQARPSRAPSLEGTVDPVPVLGTRSEDLVHPELADAFLARLQENRARALQSSGFELVPLTSFRRAALQHSVEYLVPSLIPDTSAQAEALRADLLALLADARPERRSNAAFLLGSSLQSAALATLRAALSKETDDRVRASLQFALLRLGDEAQLAPLQATFGNPEPSVAAHALQLTTWLSPELQARLNPELLVRALKNRSTPHIARVDAAFTLGRIGAVHQITETAVASLIDLCREGDEHEVEAGCAAVRGLQQLTRERVSQLLVKNDSVAVRGALFVRWASTVLPTDLFALREHYAQASVDEKHHGELGRIASVVANIPGPEALATLSQWYIDLKSENQIDYLAWLLSWRPDLSVDAQRALLARVSPEKRWFSSMLGDGNVSLQQAQLLVTQGKLKLLYRATALAGLAARAAPLPMLHQQAIFQDSVRYPADVGLRQQALAAIFRIALARSEHDTTR